MFIEEKVSSGEQLNFVYLVPTKALITEVTNDLCNKLGDNLKDNHYRIVNHFDSIGTGSSLTKGLREFLFKDLSFHIIMENIIRSCL